MSIYNVASNQTMTLSGSITAQNTTYDVASGTTLSINGTISGSGGVTKNGTGTLTLNGNNTFTGNTTINSGTLRAGAANALGDSLEVMVNSGGSLLIAASEAIDNAAAVKLNGGTMKFDGNVTETLGAFTLLANSTIDMADGHIWLQFSGLSAEMTHELKIYNYTINSDHLYFDSNTYLENSLDNIKVYSDSGSNLIGDSFIRNSFEVYPAQPNIVPEPETYATAALLLLGLGIYAYRRRQVRTPA
jgi:autotransporter-associated beta strand protein